MQVCWLGYAFLLVGLEWVSLLFPVGRSALLSLAVPAVLGIVAARRALARRLRIARRRALATSAVGLAAVVLALAIAASATQPVVWFDTYLYHLQVVKWTLGYPAVPGIENLHSRLGFDSSFHVFAALADSLWKGQSPHLALPFLALMSGLHHLEFLVGRGGAGRMLGRACAAVTAAYLLAFVGTHQLASLSNDGALALLCTAALLEMVAWRSRAAYRSGTGLAVVLALAASAFTTKMGGLAVLALAACLIFYLRGDRRRLVVSVVSTLPCLLVAGYFARQAIQSGWLLYPMPMGNLHLAWSVPRSEVVEVFELIRSWARLPNHAPSEVWAGGFWFWFPPWWANFLRSKEAVVSLLVASVLVVRAARPAWAAPFAREPGAKAAALAAVASLVFWFTGAPDLRFGRVFFWLLLATAVAPILARAAERRAGRLAVTLLLLLFVAWAGGFAIKFSAARNMLAMPPLMRFESRRVQLESGLEVLVPVDANDRCGDAELPCTPMPARQRLRRPGDLSSGFLPN
jgi:hypothetical protein